MNIHKDLQCTRTILSALYIMTNINSPSTQQSIVTTVHVAKLKIMEGRNTAENSQPIN